MAIENMGGLMTSQFAVLADRVGNRISSADLRLGLAIGSRTLVDRSSIEFEKINLVGICISPAY